MKTNNNDYDHKLLVRYHAYRLSQALKQLDDITAKRRESLKGLRQAAELLGSCLVYEKNTENLCNVIEDTHQLESGIQKMTAEYRNLETYNSKPLEEISKLAAECALHGLDLRTRIKIRQREFPAKAA